MIGPEIASRRGLGEGGFTLVELLVVMGIMGIITTALMTVIISTSRTQVYTDQMSDVMDDGRVMMDRIRKELRAARRVLDAGSTASTLHFWVDQNQDGQDVPAELICYAPREIGTSGRYELVRWTGGVTSDDCSVVGADVRVIARTLTTNAGIFEYDPTPSSDPLAPRTRLVTIRFTLQVRQGNAPAAIPVETTVRLRNVS